MSHVVTIRVMRFPLAIVCLALLALLAGMPRCSEAAEQRSQHPARLNPVGRAFAIADFDGDQRPDLATIEVHSGFTRMAGYSVHLQFSAAPASEIVLDAPFGELQIFSRDVNGDDFSDLVVTATLDFRLVTVLLNNGHGKFSLARPELFPALEKETGPAFNSISGQFIFQRIEWSRIPRTFRGVGASGSDHDRIHQSLARAGLFD